MQNITTLYVKSSIWNQYFPIYILDFDPVVGKNILLNLYGETRITDEVDSHNLIRMNPVLIYDIIKPKMFFNGRYSDGFINYELFLTIDEYHFNKILSDWKRNLSEYNNSDTNIIDDLQKNYSLYRNNAIIQGLIS